MSTETLIAIIVPVSFVLLICALGAWLVVRRRHLKERFGPEYGGPWRTRRVVWRPIESCVSVNNATTHWRSNHCRCRSAPSTPKAGPGRKSSSLTSPTTRSTKLTGS